MTKNKKIIFSFLYVVLALSVFLVYLFPAAEIRQYLLSRLNVPGSALEVTIARAKPAFPPGLTLEEVGISHQGRPLLGAERLKLTPKLWTLLGPKPTVAVDGKAGGGLLTGRMDLGKGNLEGQSAFQIALAGIRIEQNAAFNDLLNTDISGVIDGEIALEGNPTLPEKLTARLVVSDCKIGVPPGILKTGTLEFRIIKTELSVKGRNVRLEKCTFQGDRLSGSLSGSVILATPVFKSKVDLRSSLQVHPRLLQDLEGNFYTGMLNRKKQKNNRFSVHIGGTIERPTFF